MSWVQSKKIHFNVGDHHQTYWMVHLGIDVMGHPRVKQGTHYLWWFPDAYLLTCHESIRRNCALHFVFFFFWFHASFKHPQSIFLPWVSLTSNANIGSAALKQTKKRPSRLINTVIFYAYMQVSSDSSTVSNKKKKKKSRDRRYTSNKQCCSRWGSFEFKPCLDAAGETSKRRSLRSFIALVAGSTFFFLFFLIFFWLLPSKNKMGYLKCLALVM